MLKACSMGNYMQKIFFGSLQAGILSVKNMLKACRRENYMQKIFLKAFRRKNSLI